MILTKENKMGIQDANKYFVWSYNKFQDFGSITFIYIHPLFCPFNNVILIKLLLDQMKSKKSPTIIL